MSMELAGWLKQLESLHPSGIELGLERIDSVFQHMDCDFDNVTVITVAGTNGKGSTCALIEAALLRNGCDVACYTSPHLVKFNERLRLQGQACADAVWVEAFQTVESARHDIALTFFEFTTLAALYIISSHKPQFAILEVGLGGRLDAVNIVDANIAVITEIDFDHQSWLGNTLEEISREKLGIVKPSSTMVCASTAAPEIINKTANISAISYCYGKDYLLKKTRGAQSVSLAKRKSTLTVRETSIAAINIATALQVLDLLLPDKVDQLLADYLSALQFTGRFSCHQVDGVECYVDVAHNPQAIQHMCELLTPIEGRTVIVFAMLADKDIDLSIELLTPYIDAWFVADLPEVDRAAPAAEIAEKLMSTGQSQVSTSINPRQAFARARQLTTEKDRIIIAGSFFIAGDLLGYFYPDGVPLISQLP